MKPKWGKVFKKKKSKINDQEARKIYLNIAVSELVTIVTHSGLAPGNQKLLPLAAIRNNKLERLLISTTQHIDLPYLGNSCKMES